MCGRNACVVACQGPAHVRHASLNVSSRLGAFYMLRVFNGGVCVEAFVNAAGAFP
jgi:hypothetical protein